MIDYLIIGSNSFSGFFFTNFLLKKNLKVIGVSRSKQKKSLFLTQLKANNKKNFLFFKIDLNYDLKKIIILLKKFKPKYIVNFAAQGMVEESWKNPLDWYRTNTVSQIQFIEKIKNFKFIKKYIQFSTPEVYGSFKKKLAENCNYNPSTPYANSRACTDIHLMNLFKNFKFPAIITRTSNVYGEGQDLYRIIPKTICSALLNKKMNLHGNGKSVRSFIYMQDVCEALYKIIFLGKIGNIYHISTNQFISIRELCLKILIILKKNPKNFLIKTKDRIGKDMSYKLDSKKLRNNLKWKDKILLEEGLKKTILWCKANLKTFTKKDYLYSHKK